MCFKVPVSAVSCLDILQLYSVGVLFVWHSVFFCNGEFIKKARQRGLRHTLTRFKMCVHATIKPETVISTRTQRNIASYIYVRAKLSLRVSQFDLLRGPKQRKSNEENCFKQKNGILRRNGSRLLQ